MLDTLFRPALLAPALTITGYLLYQLFRPSKLPTIPIVGAEPGEWFPLLRARWRNAKDMESATLLAYERHRDEAFLLPIAGSGDCVVLPVKELHWLIEQPDSILSMYEQTKDSLQLNLTLMDPKLIDVPVHKHLISTQLTRETGNLIPILFDEIQESVGDVWGRGTETKEICVWEAAQRIVGRITNRVFVGLPLCRDLELLQNGISCAQDIPMTSTLLRFIWKPLRPLVAPFVTIPTRIHTSRFYRVLRPEIVRRLEHYEARRADPEKKASEEEPNDFLQWCIKQAKESRDPYLYDPRTLAGRVMLLNFASIHTSSFAITHVLLDLASSKKEYIDELRAEITEVLAAHGGRWDKRALAAMPKLDSVMRESQRINSFVTLATMRLVVAPEGVKTPSGVHLAPGTTVCSQSYPVFHDDDIYPDAQTFKPFRFAEKRSGGASEGSYLDSARQAWATTSVDYTAFGHGRHACPGRFFASCELKLLLAYLVTHYDFEMQEKRPKNFWFSLNRIPPMKATLKIKRRPE